MAKISVLGVDLGKNVRSVVELDASGAVVMRRRIRRETLIALAEKLAVQVAATPTETPMSALTRRTEGTTSLRSREKKITGARR